ncbi:MAG TPA: MBL fold metallo-hydrolase [Saprospiraceae bacterium]|nr:MBL fold metallo-hydrolase [Saprospiraceae bacterium]HNL39376.1 MBL fold metallo-hydrolase [Saprospiraceae bacterium]
MNLTLLGTGTSQGVPVIGCDCPVCTSDDPRDNRLRSSALLTAGDLNILIDAGPDLRQQMLRAGIRHLDAILLTHEHNDHVIGLDDIRPFNFSSGRAMSVYALPRVGEEVRKRFEYVFGHPIPGLPRIDLLPIDPEEPLRIGTVQIVPIRVMHGRLPILGFRVDEMAYLTDVKTIPEEEMVKLEGVKYLIINALHHREHPTHMTLAEALRMIARIRPEKAWLTHVSHEMGRVGDLENELPAGVYFAWDGLQITF